MPKWLGMLIHYVTFKRVFCSEEDWSFAWRWGGEWQIASPVPMSLTRYQVFSDGTRTQIEDYVPKHWGGRLWLSGD